MTAFIALLAAAASPTVPAATAAKPAADPAAEPQQSEEVVVIAQRTEGSDAYSTRGQTTATRLPLSLRETPQSVSVVTRAQIADFQLNDINQLLTTVPGINVQAGETDRVYYSARGFDIQTFQIDGIGVPFAFGIQTGSIDTAIYDHIEVVRGAPGLLSSTGNPSAVINFVRKRPRREFQASGSAQYGSFDTVRVDGDVSVPLTADGSVRARAVGVFNDTNGHLDRYELRRWTGYGIVEADLGANTVLSGGYGHQDHRSQGALWGAIPLYYSDGSRIEFDRTANIAPKWSSWNVIDRQIFGDLTHEFGNGWVGRISAIRRAQSEDNELFYVYGAAGAPDRATGLGIVTFPGAFRAQTRNLTLEAYARGPVTLFGREHDVNVGVNRSAQTYRQYSSYDFSQIGVSIPISELFDGTFPRPDFPTAFDLSLDQHAKRETAYALVRLNLADPLKLLLGANLTRSRVEGVSYGTPTSFDNTRFLPYVGVTYDLSPVFSAYASYTSIFNPQTQIDAEDRVLSPIRGGNLEAGLKGAWFGGRLNAGVAIFETRQDNTAETAGFAPSPVTGIPRSFFRGVDARSQGIEFDLGGEIAPGLQATGGFTALRVRGEQDQPVRTFVPRNTARLNVSYTVPSLPQLKVGASAQYQSRIYYDVTTQLNVPVRLQQDGYALLDLLARYDLTENVSLSANVRNVTNTRYLTALNFDAGYYGPPRTVLGTVSVRY